MKMKYMLGSLIRKRKEGEKYNFIFFYIPPVRFSTYSSVVFMCKRASRVAINTKQCSVLSCSAIVVPPNPVTSSRLAHFGRLRRIGLSSAAM